VPWQIIEQLSLLFQQFNNAIPTTTVDTSGNNLPSTRDVTLDVDEMVSVASDQPAAPTSQHLPIISTSNPAMSATVQLIQAPMAHTYLIYHQPTFNVYDNLLLFTSTKLLVVSFTSMYISGHFYI